MKIEDWQERQQRADERDKATARKIAAFDPRNNLRGEELKEAANDAADRWMADVAIQRQEKGMAPISGGREWRRKAAFAAEYAAALTGGVVVELRSTEANEWDFAHYENHLGSRMHGGNRAAEAAVYALRNAGIEGAALYGFETGPVWHAGTCHYLAIAHPYKGGRA